MVFNSFRLNIKKQDEFLIGKAGLIMDVLGVFGTPIIATLNPWALAILGIIFFTAGVSMLKYGKSKSA